MQNKQALNNLLSMQGTNGTRPEKLDLMFYLQDIGSVDRM